MHVYNENGYEKKFIELSIVIVVQYCDCTCKLKPMMIITIATLAWLVSSRGGNFGLLALGIEN